MPSSRGQFTVGSPKLCNLHTLARLFRVEVQEATENLPGFCLPYPTKPQYRKSVLEHYPHLWIAEENISSHVSGDEQSCRD